MASPKHFGCLAPQSELHCRNLKWGQGGQGHPNDEMYKSNGEKLKEAGWLCNFRSSRSLHNSLSQSSDNAKVDRNTPEMVNKQATNLNCCYWIAEKVYGYS